MRTERAELGDYAAGLRGAETDSRFGAMGYPSIPRAGPALVTAKSAWPGREFSAFTPTPRAPLAGVLSSGPAGGDARPDRAAAPPRRRSRSRPRCRALRQWPLPSRTRGTAASDLGFRRPGRDVPVPPEAPPGAAQYSPSRDFADSALKHFETTLKRIMAFPVADFLLPVTCSANCSASFSA